MTLFVYAAIDIGGLWPGNPFNSEWLISLERPGCKVEHGIFRLGYEAKSWDVVYFHWPEHTTDSIRAETIVVLENKLVALKKQSKLVMTIHNAEPHRRCDESARTLYRD